MKRIKLGKDVLENNTNYISLNSNKRILIVGNDELINYNTVKYIIENNKLNFAIIDLSSNYSFNDSSNILFNCKINKSKDLLNRLEELLYGDDISKIDSIIINGLDKLEEKDIIKLQFIYEAFEVYNINLIITSYYDMVKISHLKHILDCRICFDCDSLRSNFILGNEFAIDLEYYHAIYYSLNEKCIKELDLTTVI